MTALDRDTPNPALSSLRSIQIDHVCWNVPNYEETRQTNQRTDEYGGSVENRSRFFLEFVKAMASVRGGDCVGVKVSPWKFLPHDIEETDTEAIYPYLAEQLSPLNLAYLLHVQLPMVTYGDQPDAPLDLAQLIRPHFQRVMMVDGSLERESAIAGLESGDTDLVAFGRAFFELNLRKSLNY